MYNSEWHKEYYEKNRERIITCSGKRYKNNREEARETMREYYCKNKIKCLERAREYRKTHKNEKAAYSKQYAKNNKDKHRNKYLEIEDWYFDNISYLKCPDCGYSFKKIPQLAEFHHLENHPNNKAIKSALRSYGNFCREVEKGIYLCPTCHRLRHIIGR